MKQSFPKIITDLPEADIEIKGAKGWIAQGKDHQILFIDMEPSVEESEHSHGFPSWLLIVEGKMEVTVNGKSKIYEKGDDVFARVRSKCVRW